MRMRKLGQSGLFVSELCLGTMTFGSKEGIWAKMGSLDQSAVDRLVSTALEAGINFIDTANIYSDGQSESFTGQALRNLKIKREDVVIATKVLGPMGEGPNARGGSRGHILNQCQASLKRLGVDYIDLYQLHGFDAATPIVETLEAFDTLVRHGHVRYIGLSNWAAWQVVKAVGITQLRELMPIISLQAYYTLVGRDLERDIVPMLKSENIGLMVWSPLAGGYLSGKYDGDGKTGDGRRANFEFPPVDTARGQDVVAVMRDIANAKGVTVAQIALAWLLHQEVVTSVIVGAKKVDQLTDNIRATEVQLSADELEKLQEASALSPEYPGWMLSRQGAYRH